MGILDQDGRSVFGYAGMISEELVGKNDRGFSHTE
jgi:hypothetical protein